jgi:guanylate kinase
MQKSGSSSGQQGILCVLSGPSGVGKNTVLNALLSEDPRVRYSISVTTRPPRPGESHGVNYFFVSDQEFDAMIRDGELLEWAVFCNHRYGTPRSYVQQYLEQGYHVVLDIDVQGAAGVREKMPQGVFVFLMPPSWNALEERIRMRGTETESAIQRRLERAMEEMRAVTQYQYVVWNDDVLNAVRRLQAILAAEECRVHRDANLSRLRDYVRLSDEQG